MFHVKQDIETALKMLDARGGELDKIAAGIIRKLRKLPFGQHPAVSDEQWDATIYAGKLAALQTEHRGALLELNEIYSILGRALREHEGDFEDTDTARSLADEAGQVIRDLRKQNGDLRGQIMQRGIETSPLVKDLKAQLEGRNQQLIAANERISKLMERQQALMNAVVDAQLQRGAFAPGRQATGVSTGDVPRGTFTVSATDGREYLDIKPLPTALPLHGHPMLTAPTIQVDGFKPVGVNLPAPGEVATVVLHRDDLSYDAPNVSRETLREPTWHERVAAETEVLRGQKWSEADLKRFEEMKAKSFFRAVVGGEGEGEK